MPLIGPTRRAVIAAVPTVAALAVTRRAWACAASPSLAFVAIGDWGRNGAAHQRDVALQMGRAAHAANSAFTVSTGDNFYESGVASANDPQWQTSFEDVYTDPALQALWYAVLGNHDYRGTPQAEVDYTARSRRWRMPSRYYKVSGDVVGYSSSDMFFIDTSPLVHKYRPKVEDVIAANVAPLSAATQLAWLDAELGRSTAPWKLVFGHHTIYSGGSAHGNTRELIAQVKPLLETHGVQAYINGHEHDLQHIRVGPVNYICMGAGSGLGPTGRIDGTLFALSRSGFATMKVDSDALRLTFIDYTGVDFYTSLIHCERASAAA